jgi:hypothetical protein
MTRVLTYVEIDAPQWTQTSPDSPRVETTYRFAIDTDYLPNSIPAIPSITDISFSPATISLGTDLGQRASITVTFRDHRHIFDGETFNSGTFWGKWRARYGIALSGNPFRLIRGTLGQTLSQMDTRHFIIDSFNGPSSDGSYQIVGKDIFTLLRGEKAQAPRLSPGRLAADMPAGSLTLSLNPPGIISQYPTSAYVNIGGTEILFYDLTTSPVTIQRSRFNTVDQGHLTGDRVQVCVYYNAQNPADILYDLLVNYGGVDPDFIPLADWHAEVAAYLPGVTYTAVLSDPLPVDQLVAELIEQAALALWWNSITQTIRLQVLRPVPTDAATFDQTMTLLGTLEVTEQPEKRLSEVQVFFGKFTPLLRDGDLTSYRASVSTTDQTAVFEYGSAAIKSIFSRWIPDTGRLVAQTLANKQLGRFRDPPRRVTFQLMRNQTSDPELGGGYLLGGTPFQTMAGVPHPIPIQVTRLAAMADHFEVEAEEVLWTPFGADIAPAARTITFSGFTFNANLRSVHDSLYPTSDYLPVQAGDTVNVLVQSTAHIVSNDPSMSAFDVGSWPVGVTINLTIAGTVEAAGGNGGNGGDAVTIPVVNGGPGIGGGTALFTRYPIRLTTTGAILWGGGGGGGGDGAISLGGANTQGGNGGGGGAGVVVGSGGAAGHGTVANGTPGNSGTSTAGGTPRGGGPGLAGTAGANALSNGGAGGTAGRSIDGISFVTTVGAVGDIRGPQVN